MKSKQKTWTDTSPKRIHSGQISTWKCTRHHISLGNCKFKHQDSTTHLLEWLKCKTLTTANAYEKEILFTTSENAVSIAILEDSLANSCKVKYYFTMQSITMLLWKWVENMSTPKHKHKSLFQVHL